MKLRYKAPSGGGSIEVDDAATVAQLLETLKSTTGFADVTVKYSWPPQADHGLMKRGHGKGRYIKVISGLDGQGLDVPVIRKPKGRMIIQSRKRHLSRRSGELRRYVLAAVLMARGCHAADDGPKNPLNCLHVSCKRHSGKGFTRLENLDEHLRRVHPSSPDSVAALDDKPQVTNVGLGLSSLVGEKRKADLCDEVKRLRAEHGGLRGQVHKQRDERICPVLVTHRRSLPESIPTREMRWA
ncbi:Uu.00g032300.m01.CDS01 [Anthostomella pinea]|uniref:ubiquitinyl hydrolase 1 n=1 Tax=Anthostomella pinea TaxID=933095 RepID=A0AAI8V955_9PEZI|nr:Uu.00g032300.m01.CDS01 [Anthostomella pinea]